MVYTKTEEKKTNVITIAVDIEGGFYYSSEFKNEVYFIHL